MRAAVLILSVALLSACVATTFNRSATPNLYTALDSQLDGYSGALASGAGHFEIVSTRTDGRRLCRVVNVETEGRFHTESFCKIRGGEWR